MWERIMSIINHNITPNLWFDRQAEEAARLYSSAFENSRIGRVTRAGKAGFEITGLTEGTTLSVEFYIEGQQFIAINGGPIFKFNPTISFLVACKTQDEVDFIWKILSEGGSVLMELGKYPHSERYGWTQDKWGLSWQVMYMGNIDYTQKITPTLMFAGEQYGKAESAINFYASVFNTSGIGGIMRYSQGMQPDKVGTIQHADFILEGQGFAAMDSARVHDVSFSEAISLMVECSTQNEIDYYWNKLTADGGQESMCGWLKDRFGVSWQVVPKLLGEMLGNPDTEKVKRVTQAFLKMKKLDIVELKKAYQG
jgi:predicted 3-demethylubiquinone-9 3-methyltransferase (glyoxalase superfamily)